MSRAGSIRRLFDSAVPSGEKWWRDGFFDETRWTARHRRILFILKEPSFEPCEREDSLVTLPNSGDLWWRPLCLWSHAALYTTMDHIPTLKDAMESRPGDSDHEAGRSAALMNLKKEAGGTSANMDSIRDWANDHKDFLSSQFDLIEPNLVICCGSVVWSIAQQVLNVSPVEPLNRYAFSRDRLWIDLRHPVRAPHSTFDTLVEILRTALSDPRCPKDLIAGEPLPPQAGPEAD